MANRNTTPVKIESEKVLERKLNAEVKSLGGLSIKLLPFLFRGLPDRMCLLPFGNILFCEIKTTTKEPTPIQLLVHKKIRNLGFRVEVIDTTEQINTILSDYAKRNEPTRLSETRDKQH